MDFTVACTAVTVFSPLLLLLTVSGAVFMRGKPFFVQKRIGRNEEVFRLIKFRTMNDKKDRSGVLLPDEKRLTTYGKLLRRSSLDELPELFNIIRGDMSFVGPRPLLTEYLPYYTAEERRRHSVLPGLTGLAQINGRNDIKSWEERFAYDLRYVDSLSFRTDIRIITGTFSRVFSRAGVLTGSEIPAGRLDDARRKSADADGNKKI